MIAKFKNNFKPTVTDMNIQSVLNSMQDSFIIIIDTNGIVLFLNQSPEAYKFLDSPIHLGKSFFEVISKNKSDEVKELCEHLINTGLSFRNNVDKLSHGIRIHFEIRYSPILDEQDMISSILIEGRDISNERMYSNKIKRVTNDFTNLVENANAVIIGTDNQGYITDWNNRCEEVTGYSKQETLSNSFVELLLDRETREEFRFTFKSLLDGHPLNNYELPLNHKNGERRILLINVTARRNVTGLIDGFLLVGQDVTELIAYRNSLEDKVSARTALLNETNLEIRKQKEIVEQEREKSDELLLNILPEFVAQELKSKGHVIPRHYDSTTILFADLVGFTTLCKGLTPEQIIYELNYIFVGFDMILEKYGMEKIKTIGDGYMAVGGLPIPNDTHPSDAVKAGLDMVAFVDRVKKENQISSRPPWQAKVGIHTGELTAGVIGRNKFAYDVWGGAVNIASRMESSSDKGKVNISGATYKEVKDEFILFHRGSINAKNMGNLDMYFVEGLK